MLTDFPAFFYIDLLRCLDNLLYFLLGDFCSETMKKNNICISVNHFVSSKMKKEREHYACHKESLLLRSFPLCEGCSLENIMASFINCAFHTGKPIMTSTITAQSDSFTH